MIEPNQINVPSRDHELLRMLSQGCSNEDIASFLNVRPSTVEKHLQSLFLNLLVATKAGPIPGPTTEDLKTEKPQPTVVGAAPDRKASLYGLPCSHCRIYYSADMDVCPICKSPDRVSPNAVPPLSVVPEITNPDPRATTSLAASSHP